MWCHFNFNLISCVTRQWVSATAAYKKHKRATKISTSESRSSSNSSGCGHWRHSVCRCMCECHDQKHTELHTALHRHHHHRPCCSATSNSFILVHSAMLNIEPQFHEPLAQRTIVALMSFSLSLFVCVRFKFKINILLIRNVDVLSLLPLAMASTPDPME